MKLCPPFLCGLLLLLCLKLVAQDKEYSGDPDASFLVARDLAFSGNYAQAQDTLRRVLDKYPDYADVRTLMAKTYSWEKRYDLARGHFNRVTSQERHHKETWVAAIKNEQYAGNWQIALGLTNKALNYMGQDTTLLRLREASIAALESPIQGSAARMEQPAALDTESLTLYTEGEVFDQLLDPMYLGALEYKKKFKWGTLLPRLTYNRRFNINGVQAELDAYPQFSKTLRGYVNVGVSPAEIFPRFRAGGELTAAFPKGMEVSLGLRHLAFSEDRATLLTGSFGFYKGNYYTVFRPYLLPSGQRGPSLSGSLLSRKYLRDKNHFFGLNLVYGFDAEVNQFIVDGTLLAETLMYLEVQRLRLEYQFTNSKGNEQYRLHLGANRQEMAFDSNNFFLSVTAGIAYQIKFEERNVPSP
ncbi:YaiO family outer membrane beta-barrel protein [Maribacter sp. 2307ULW6-5]|uniref:YaiO family outer membrane beta-barrel protein n=1 Tax=Maribacter sp. 2307ULW6-5 TaxID=3386275 RepID=UPI0039BD0DDF